MARSLTCGGPRLGQQAQAFCSLSSGGATRRAAMPVGMSEPITEPNFSVVRRLGYGWGYTSDAVASIRAQNRGKMSAGTAYRNRGKPPVESD